MTGPANQHKLVTTIHAVEAISTLFINSLAFCVTPNNVESASLDSIINEALTLECKSSRWQLRGRVAVDFLFYFLFLFFYC